jgi:hypothetical protein
MRFTVAGDETIDGLYGRALIVLREIEVEERDGKSKCRCCSSKKSNHLGDGRCSSSAVSREFINDRYEERDAANRALELVEALRKL